MKIDTITKTNPKICSFVLTFQILESIRFMFWECLNKLPDFRHESVEKYCKTKYFRVRLIFMNFAIV